MFTGLDNAWIDEVLDYWFGPLDEHGLASSERSQRWWAKDEAFDREIEERFGPLLEAADRGELSPSSDPRARLAALIVLDQFSRNVGRGSAAMFEHDGAALRLAKRMVQDGDDRALPASMRSFCYMPYMHSEDLADQERCIELFEVMAKESSGPVHDTATNQIDFARRHRDIIARFGRFPHRNELLGRESTAEERAFLQEDGSSF